MNGVTNFGAGRGTTKTGVRTLMGSTALGLAMLVVPASAQQRAAEPATSAQAQRSFNIAAQPLTRGVTLLGDQADIQVTVDGSILAGVNGQAVVGTFRVEEALGRLLAGTGITWRWINNRSVALERARVAQVGEVQLGTLRVEGAGGTGSVGQGGVGSDADGTGNPSDAPYRRPGSSSHVSREQIDRIMPTSPGDVLTSVPGVVNSGTHVGASLNVNIRGMQGMGRVSTTIDGSHQTSTSFRGYPGSRDETYVDPDMIGSIDVTKGPSEGIGAGGIGGSVSLRTLAATDIVPAGKEWAVRLRGSLGNNTNDSLSDVYRNPPAVSPAVQPATERPDFFAGDTWSGSIAVGVVQENFEAVAAYSKREQGNYFAGRKSSDGVVPRTGDYQFDVRNAHTPIAPGKEVYNSSQDVESLLLKGRVNWGDGQSVELGYMLFDSWHGELHESATSVAVAFPHWPLSHTTVHTYTAKYRALPTDNPLLRLRANFYYTDLFVDRIGANGNIYDHGMKTFGGDIDNTSRIDTGWGALTINIGAEYRREQGVAEQQENTTRWTSMGPSGVRGVGAAFVHGRLEPLPWLSVSAGARYDFYNARGEGYAAGYPEKSGSRISPNATITVTPFDGIQLYAAYKEGMRAPNLRELYWNYLSNVSINPALKPEISKSREVGVNVLRDGLLFNGDKLRVKLAYFDNHYDDYIMTQSINGGFDYHFANIIKGRHEGIDLAASYDAGWFFTEVAYNQFLAIENCTVAAGCKLAKGDSSIIMGPADFVNYRPAKYSGNVTAGVRLFDQVLTLGGRLRFSSTRYGSPWPPQNGIIVGIIGNTATWPSYELFDLFGSLVIGKNTMLNVSVENIADKYYFTEATTAGIPSPGRTARVTFTQRIGGGTGFLPFLPEISLVNAGKGAPGEDWTGLYGGFHGGYTRAKVSGTTVASDGSAVAATESAHYTDSQAQAGVHLGINFQLPSRIVVGIEGDLTSMGQRSLVGVTPVTEVTYATGEPNTLARTRFGLESMSTVRARIGYAPGRSLLYATGGVAFLNETGSRDQHIANAGSRAVPYGARTQWWFSETDEVTRTGWTGGAGIEQAVGRHLTLRAEFLHASFGDGEALVFDQARQGVGRRYVYQGDPVVDPNCTRFCSPTRPTIIVPGTSSVIVGREARNKANVNSVRLGISYRF